MAEETPTTNTTPSAAAAIAATAVERVRLPSTLRGYARFIVAAVPEEESALYSFGIGNVLDTAGARRYLRQLTNNCFRSRKGHVRGELCPVASPFTDSHHPCPDLASCPKIHVTSDGWRDRRPWVCHTKGKAEGETDADAEVAPEGATGEPEMEAAKQEAATKVKETATTNEEEQKEQKKKKATKATKEQVREGEKTKERQEESERQANDQKKEKRWWWQIQEEEEEEAARTGTPATAAQPASEAASLGAAQEARKEEGGAEWCTYPGVYVGHKDSGKMQRLLARERRGNTRSTAGSVGRQHHH
eukprot:TRINITY_DN1217_c0_g1_i1.p1 TRINITY_DN1217_c0_g1~~TRINITY_DN1217_c0_g1_i1.p1  ORF type:complete len:304 (+),score=79.43 TRINITY_DN1217_c0_g1_i1:51-962(+)